MGAEARVYIKIDVDNAAGEAKLAATRAKIEAISKSTSDLTERTKKLERALKDEETGLRRATKNLDEKAVALRAATSASKMFASAGGALAKVIKWGTIEFGAMTAVLGGLKVALLAGQWVMKGFHASMLAMGAAAGVAVAALAGLLGAMRELQVAKMSPQFKSVYGMTPPGSGPDASRYRSSRGLVNRTMGDQRFGMFSDAGLGQAMSQQLNSGQQVGGAFRNQLARLGDFSGGDEKTLLALNAAMAEGAKAGKITQSVYDQLTKSSPAIKAAFEEMTGGQKQAEAAAEKGSISFAQFQTVLMEGKLKALAPYNGALNEINNTIMGKFKGGVRAIKEELTSLSETSAKALYGKGSNMSIMDAIHKPIDQLVLSLKSTIGAIGPSILQTVPGMFGGMTGLFEKATDKMTVGIVRGMDWLSRFDNTLNEWIGKIRTWFSDINAYLVKVTQPFDMLWKSVLVPLGEFLVNTVNTAIETFSKNVTDNAGMIDQWSKAFDGLTTAVEIFFGGLSLVKTVMTPFVTVVAEMLGILGKVFGTAVLGGAAKMVAGWGLMWLSISKVVKTTIEWKKSLVEAFTSMNKAKSEWTVMTESAAMYRRELERIVGLAAGIGPGGSSGGIRGPISGAPTQRRTNADVGSVVSGGATTIIDPASGETTFIGPRTKSGWWGSRWAEKKFGTTGFLNGYRGYSRSTLGGIADANMDPALRAEREVIKQQAARTRWAAGSGIGLMMAGGMITQASGRNAAGAGFGSLLSGAGGGGMVGSMLPGFGPMAKMNPNQMAAGGMIAGAGLSAGTLVQSRTANTSLGGQVISNGLKFGGTGAGLGFMIGGAPGAVVGGAIGTGLGIGYGVWSADRAVKQAGDDAYDHGRLYATTGNVNTMGDLRERRAANRARLDDVRRAGQQLQELGRDTNWTGSRQFASGLIKEKMAQVDGATGDKKEQYQRELDALRKERSDLAKWATDMGHQIAGHRAAFEKLNKMGRSISANVSSGNFFGFNPKEIAAYADRNNMSLGKVQLAIKDMVKLSGFGKNAMENFALSAKRTYEYLMKPFQPQRDAAQAGVDSRRRFADYLTNLNQPMDKDSRYLATYDAVDALSSQGTSMFAAGAYGRGAGAYGRFRADQSGKIDRAIEMARARPGATKENIDMLTMIATAQKTSLNEGMSFGDMFKLDPTVGKDMASMGKVSSFNVIGAVEKGKAEGRTTKELGEIQKKAIDSQALAMATAMKERYNLKDDVNTLATKMKGSIVGTLQDEGQKVYQQSLTGLAKGAAAAASTISNALAQMRLVVDGKGWKWVSGGSGGGGGSSLPREMQYSVATPQTTWDWVAKHPRAGALPPGMGYAADGTVTAMSSGDTPSSRFAQTLATASSLNRFVPGKRSITSGIRNYNLGSLNSDHRTGAAIDVTGQNLGAYAQLISKSGGFAEFHGSGDGRHLHAVMPHGDTASPFMGSAVGGGGTMNVTVNVYGGPGDSAASIADEVIARVSRIQRNAMERS